MLSNWICFSLLHEYLLLILKSIPAIADIFTTMDQDLDVAIRLVRSDVKVKYINQGSVDTFHGFRELIIERHKLDDCPNVSKLMNKFEKKITNTSLLKTQKYTRQLCILLLTSSGYGVNSSIFNDISDIFIEKCWECIQYISYTTSEPLRSWIKKTMANRNPPSFSALFCPPRRLPERVVMDNIFPDRLSSIGRVDNPRDNIPTTVWHRDDIVMQTILCHLKYRDQSS